MVEMGMITPLFSPKTGLNSERWAERYRKLTEMDGKKYFGPKLNFKATDGIRPRWWGGWGGLKFF